MTVPNTVNVCAVPVSAHCGWRVTQCVLCWSFVRCAIGRALPKGEGKLGMFQFISRFGLSASDDRKNLEPLTNFAA